jgi:hypothetical protein
MGRPHRKHLGWDHDMGIRRKMKARAHAPVKITPGNIFWKV